MKNLTFVGIILLAIGVLLFYLNNMALDLRVVYGALCGIGVGLIFGGIVGYVSKGSAVKQENKMRQFKQLQKKKMSWKEASSIDAGCNTRARRTKPECITIRLLFY